MKNPLAVLTLALVVALGGYTFTHQTQPTQSQSPTLGALAGPDIISPYLNWGGVYEYHAAQAAVATSSVVCSLLSPASTSTLEFATFLASANGLGTQTLAISTSTSAVGSSTPALVQVNTITLGVPLVWDGTFGTSTEALVLSPKDTTGLNPYVLPPSTYVTFRIASGTPGTFASYVTANCQASFITL